MKSDDKFYEEFYENRYKQKTVGKIFRFKNFLKGEHLRIYQRHLKPLKAVSTNTATLVDLGAGKSTYLETRPDTIKVDISGSVLKKYVGPTVICSLERIDLESSIADVVICSQTLEHVSHPEQALSEMSRICKAGGVLVLTVPNRYALMKKRYHELERLIDSSGHIHEFREAWLHFELKKRGFKIIRSEGACYGIFNFLGSLERSSKYKLIKFFIAKIPSNLIAWTLEFDNKIHRRKLSGMSLEIVAEKRE